jgi:hypothetical protein
MRTALLALAVVMGGPCAATLRAEPGEHDEERRKKGGAGKDGEGDKEERRKKEEEEARRRAEAELNWDKAGTNGGVAWPDVPDVDAMVESAVKAKAPAKAEAVAGEPKPGIAGYEKEPAPLEEAEVQEAVGGSFGEEAGDASWLER